ncbi:hypothetical protein VP01_68g3 [Puccinia sorghi]|uniref:Uncharacterized protein n=1 Tax=Puccinia sorghi TaxID=27349 RepID=A0A0L6UF34_9BASI|nr:hypothetical protein VP01_68g3 [Puccinia sorghi]
MKKKKEDTCRTATEYLCSNLRRVKGGVSRMRRSSKDSEAGRTSLCEFVCGKQEGRQQLIRRQRRSLSLRHTRIAVSRGCSHIEKSVGCRPSFLRSTARVQRTQIHSYVSLKNGRAWHQRRSLESPYVVRLFIFLYAKREREMLPRDKASRSSACPFMYLRAQEPCFNASSARASPGEHVPVVCPHPCRRRRFNPMLNQWVLHELHKARLLFFLFSLSLKMISPARIELDGPYMMRGRVRFFSWPQSHPNMETSLVNLLSRWPLAQSSAPRCFFCLGKAAYWIIVEFSAPPRDPSVLFATPSILPRSRVSAHQRAFFSRVFFCKPNQYNVHSSDSSRNPQERRSPISSTSYLSRQIMCSTSSIHHIPPRHQYNFLAHIPFFIPSLTVHSSSNFPPSLQLLKSLAFPYPCLFLFSLLRLCCFLYLSSYFLLTFQICLIIIEMRPFPYLASPQSETPARNSLAESHARVSKVPISSIRCHCMEFSQFILSSNKRIRVRPSCGWLKQRMTELMERQRTMALGNIFLLTFMSPPKQDAGHGKRWKMASQLSLPAPIADWPLQTASIPNLIIIGAHSDFPCCLQFVFSLQYPSKHSLPSAFMNLVVEILLLLILFSINNISFNYHSSIVAYEPLNSSYFLFILVS